MDCKKESTIKADGKGLAIPLRNITIGEGKEVNLNNKAWFIYQLTIDQDYSASLAIDYPVTAREVEVQFINFFQIHI